MRRLLACVALLAALAPTLGAQRLGPHAPRPQLLAGADTNDANAYFDVGVAQFDRDPEVAAAAFYWAARINPGWGEALYARRQALLMTDQRLLQKVMQGNRRTIESNEVRKLDSLQFRALMLSPFLYRNLDRRMFVAYIKYTVTGGSSDGNNADMDFAIERYLRDTGDEMRAWLAYSDGDLTTALGLYARALSNAKDKASVRLDRARIFAQRSHVDSATAEFNLALAEMRKKDQKDLVVLYNSKALVEYSVGVLLEGNGDAAGAREAYGRALQEDLSYYPAHMRLGLLALGAKDTASAMSELALASQLAPDEPHIRYTHGFVLAASGHYADGVAELKKAIALEPYYALPYLRLAQSYEQLRKGKEAADAFQGFLDHASVKDPQREYATGHLAEIKEILAAAAAVGKP